MSQSEPHRIEIGCQIWLEKKKKERCYFIFRWEDKAFASILKKKIISQNKYRKIKRNICVGSYSIAQSE